MPHAAADRLPTTLVDTGRLIGPGSPRRLNHCDTTHTHDPGGVGPTSMLNAVLPVFAWYRHRRMFSGGVSPMNV